MVTTVEHDEARGRFVILHQGQVAGHTAYERDDQVWVFTHTEVDPEYSGQGLAGKLVGHALDTVIAAGGTIQPVCSYVVSYINKHPQYQQHTLNAP